MSIEAQDTFAGYHRALADIKTQTDILQSYLDSGVPTDEVGQNSVLTDLLKMSLLLASIVTGQFT